MTKQLVRFGAAVMATVLALLVLWQFRIVVVYLLVSLALAATVRPLARYGAGRPLPVRLGLILLYLVALGGIGVVLFLAFKSAVGDVEQMAGAASEQGEWQLPRWLAGTRFQAALVERLPTPNELLEAVTGEEGQNVLPALLGITQSIGSLVSGTVVILFLSLYWSTSQTHFERLWLSLLPPGQRTQVRDLWRTIEHELGTYIRSQLAVSLLTGVLLGVGYWALGSPYPMFLALIGAVVCLIPVVGSPLALLPPILLGLLTSTETGALTAVYTLIVLTALAMWVRPRLFHRVWSNPLLTVVILIAMADAFGLLGLVIAPPLAAALQILWSSLVSRRVVSGSGAQVSDLKERQVQLWATIQEMDGAPLPLVRSSMERLSGLIEKAEPLLQPAAPAEQSEPDKGPAHP